MEPPGARAGFAIQVEAEAGGGGLGPEAAWEALAGRYGVGRAKLDGWVVAENLSRVGAEIHDPELKAAALRLAAQAVIRRACRLVGPLRVAKKVRYGPLDEPFRGELSVERTLENMGGRELPEPADWIVGTRDEHDLQVVLMMDTSLSMSGRNLALAALAAAVLALKIPRGDLGVIAFESMARTVCPLGEQMAPEAIVEGVLRQPARGYTNLEDALTAGAKQLTRQTGAARGRVGLLITDGVYTVGGDPVPLAARFPRLFVMLTEDYKTDEDRCRRMARLGRGELFRVRHFDDMPARMLEIVNRLHR